MFISYELRILDIKYHTENRSHTGSQVSSFVQRSKRVPSRYQVEIKGLITMVRFPVGIVKNGRKYEKEMKKQKKRLATKKNNQNTTEPGVVNRKKVMIKTNLYFYSAEEHINHENQDIETRIMYKRMKSLKRGDTIVIFYPAPDFKSIDPRYESENLVRSTDGEVIAVFKSNHNEYSFYEGKYPFKIDNILIDKCTLTDLNCFIPGENGLRQQIMNSIPIGLTQCKIKYSNKISKIWSYIQLKIPLIPQTRYHLFYRYRTIESKIKMWIAVSAGVLLFLLTVFPEFPDNSSNLITRLVITGIVIFKEFIE